MTKTENLKGGVYGSVEYDRITIALPVGYKKRLKAYAKARNLTMTGLLERYIRRILPTEESNEAS